MAGKPDGKPRGKPGGLPDRDPLSKLSDRAKDYAEDDEPGSFLAGLARSSGRARRKDATGRAKKDYHKASVTIAVRVSEEIADQVRDRAESAGQSVNAWLLALIERELQAPPPDDREQLQRTVAQTLKRVEQTRTVLDAQGPRIGEIRESLEESDRRLSALGDRLRSGQ